jgi:hypothetical protein
VNKQHKRGGGCEKKFFNKILQEAYSPAERTFKKQAQNKYSE